MLASLKLTSAHRESVKDHIQDTCVREKNSDGHTQLNLRYHYQTLKLARLKGKTAAKHQALPQPSKPYMKQSQDTGASSWLNAIPKEDEDWGPGRVFSITLLSVAAYPDNSLLPWGRVLVLYQPCAESTPRPQSGSQIG